ncbi:metal-dependent transcriptional regulator [Bifidobacterium sp. H6bp22N]|uniref:metal-dependent transcriptional regulator n=1 Tax=Bifidobacterium polysaccharolyticum TaxID=2750967 RepID=UPI0028BEF9D8|nr:metal-dependent transcriptional regulator [Bifidobacterium sp. H6bp22N]MDT7507392.1 metal-dependent transcriptional regulator [Bifidobacterium sp. H6bp22N]
MDVIQLSTNVQDYLKVIWDLEEWDDGPVHPTDIAERTGMKQSTISGALSRMVNAGLVEHKPYGRVGLTSAGRRSAVTMVRRHRLLETFLVEVLGYTWDEVHEEADALEHAVSEKLVDRIDRYLGHPAQDPHGDAIPTESGSMPVVPLTKSLSQVEDGQTVRVWRVSDQDPALLRYLSRHGVGPGTSLKLVSPGDASQGAQIRVQKISAGQSSPNRDENESKEVAEPVELDDAQASRIQVVVQ